MYYLGSNSACFLNVLNFLVLPSFFSGVLNLFGILGDLLPGKLSGRRPIPKLVPVILEPFTVLALVDFPVCLSLLISFNQDLFQNYIKFIKNNK
jgi:hypothetical protein